MRGSYTREKELIKKILAVGCKDKFYEETVARCFKSLMVFNEELHRHSVNVSILSVIIGMYVGMSTNNIKDLFVSGLLHDYGKLYIPRTILDKPDVLTVIERKEIEKHVELGYSHLKKEKYFSDKILLGVLEHHERVDETGYGKGISEKEISEIAMIIMIADVYDAMISDRVYRTRIDRGIVYEYLFRNAGRHFNKSIIMSFINNTISMDLDYVIRETERSVFDYYSLEATHG